jgi:hypothetical protein
MIALGVFLQAEKSLCQCGAQPTLSIKSNVITVSGQALHLSARLPSSDEHWFYSATCHSSRLFNFSLWTIDKFADRDGYYRATSWNLQVLDSKDYPEKELIFERENQFYFWGNIDEHQGFKRIRVDSIVGLPNQLHGTITLNKVADEDQRNR